MRRFEGGACCSEHALWLFWRRFGSRRAASPPSASSRAMLERTPDRVLGAAKTPTAIASPGRRVPVPRAWLLRPATAVWARSAVSTMMTQARRSRARSVLPASMEECASVAHVSRAACWTVATSAPACSTPSVAFSALRVGAWPSFQMERPAQSPVQRDAFAMEEPAIGAVSSAGLSRPLRRSIPKTAAKLATS
jgi:hypothetical protein